MIILVNGPFGVGKTTTAQLLVEHVPYAMVYDPEIIGSCVQYLLKPIEHVDDFQDYVVWRSLTVEVARMLRGTYNRSLIVPMSIIRRDYYEVILSGFRQIDPDVACFCLMASQDVLKRRIEESDDQQARVWRLQHMEQGLAALRDPAFGIKIQTDNHTPADVVDIILNKLPTVISGAL
jgi:hypothetical protein